MKLRPAHIVLLSFWVLCVLSSCTDRVRIIPKNKMAQIYAEMFIADQWVYIHPASRTHADTTLLYEPIFQKYGYTFEDYNASVSHYIVDPDTYVKILDKTVKILEKHLDRVTSMKDVENSAKKANAMIKGYESTDFEDTTLIRRSWDAWRGFSIVEKADTVGSGEMSFTVDSLPVKRSSSPEILDRIISESAIEEAESAQEYDELHEEMMEVL